MITRTVRAENMLTALEVIKKELGSDALITSVKQIMSGPSWQVWRKPLVEVVAVRLVEGEEPEQLMTAFSHQQDLNNRNKGSGSSDMDESLMENFEPQAIDDLLDISPELIKEKKKSVYLQNYVQDLGRAQMDVVQELPGTEKKGEKILPEKLQKSPQAKKSEFISHKKEVQIPVFEHITSDSINKKDRTEATDDEPAPKFDFSRQNQGPLPAEMGEDLHLPPLVLKTYQYLLSQNLDRLLLQKVTRRCADTLPPDALGEKKRVWDSIQKQLESVITIQPEIVESMPRVIFLIGMSGVGKTSTLAKLAAHLMVDKKKKVGWVCADTVRIGALGEARTYSEIMGIPLQVTYTPDELQNAVSLFNKEMDFTLVDTPAFNPRDEQSMIELGEKISAIPTRNTWIVLSATEKENDLQNALVKSSAFRPKGIIFSKLDATNHFSDAFHIAWKSQLPLTYFSFGSEIINNFIPASAGSLVKALFDERFMP